MKEILAIVISITITAIAVATGIAFSKKKPFA